MSESVTMIERVAHAISRSFHEEGYIEGLSHPSEWDEFVKAARAAIEAMRDPTPEMVNAAWADALAEDAAGVWQAMIAAALSEDEGRG